jgi:hypothetical protein
MCSVGLLDCRLRTRLFSTPMSPLTKRHVESKRRLEWITAFAGREGVFCAVLLDEDASIELPEPGLVLVVEVGERRIDGVGHFLLKQRVVTEKHVFAKDEALHSLSGRIFSDSVSDE